MKTDKCDATNDSKWKEWQWMTTKGTQRVTTKQNEWEEVQENDFRFEMKQKAKLVPEG